MVSRIRTRLPHAPGVFALLLACSDRQVDLAYLPSGEHATTAGSSVPDSIAGIDTDSIAVVVDERPDGAASLDGGTVGGGTWDAAVEQGTWVEVRDASTLIEAVGGDAPSIVLIHPGDYDLGEDEPREVQVCEVQCPAGSERGSELSSSGNCDDPVDLLTTESRMRRLRVGSNKTLIGLREGVTLRNVTLDLSGSSNVILRNLEITDVNPGLVSIGDAIVMWPSRHVWVDHCSFSNSSHTFINIHSDWDQESPTYAVTEFGSHITLSYNHFLGQNAASCDGLQNWGVGTQRNPALTTHHNVVIGGYRGYPYLFGSETWGHVYNNYVQDVASYGVGVVCGAQGVIEANVFQGNTLSVHVGDGGTPTWPFCAEGLFGRAYFPVDESPDTANNLLDADSDVDASDQPLDGSALELPPPTGSERVVSIPATGAPESYSYTLEPATLGWAEALVQQAGVGNLF